MVGSDGGDNGVVAVVWCVNLRVGNIQCHLYQHRQVTVLILTLNNIGRLQCRNGPALMRLEVDDVSSNFEKAHASGICYLWVQRWQLVMRSKVNS